MQISLDLIRLPGSRSCIEEYGMVKRKRTLKMPKVSICIPAYRDREGLERLLNSIVAQSFTDYEVIVSDDVTDDNDMTSLEDIADRYRGIFGDRLIYKRHISTGRPGDNWNSSIDKAQGQYIKMMLHDDWFTDKDSLSEYVALIDGSDAPLAFSGTWEVSADWRYARHITDRDAAQIEQDIRNLYTKSVIGAPSATIYTNTGRTYDPKLKWLIDMEFYIRQISAGGGVFVYTNKPLMSIGRSDSQMTSYCLSHPNLVRKEYYYVYNKLGLKCNKMYTNYLKSQLIKPH